MYLKAYYDTFEHLMKVWGWLGQYYRHRSTFCGKIITLIILLIESINYLNLLAFVITAVDAVHMNANYTPDQWKKRSNHGFEGKAVGRKRRYEMSVFTVVIVRVVVSHFQ